MSDKPEQLYGIKWRADQIEADVIDARPRFSIARAAAEAKRRWDMGGLDPKLEADLRACMATGEGFDGEAINSYDAYDDDGRPIER